MRGAPDAGIDTAIRDAARATELDRYLSALLAPRRVRADLIGLAAFVGETARIVDAVSEPMIGEIRLQWWRDALAGLRAGQATGSPIADGLGKVLARHHLPEQSFDRILEARARALLPQFPESEQEIEDYLRDSEGTALQLAAGILGVDLGGRVDGLLNAAAQSIGRVRLLRSLPAARANGRRVLPIPVEPASGSQWQAAAKPVHHAARAWLEEARLRATAALGAVLPAILPLALVEPYLAAISRLGPNIASERAEISPLTRVWRLWRASTLGRV